jgi:UDP-glucuronate 4-epimerase
MARPNTGKETMNVVVTGAAGFIGSHLCEALCASGMKVLGIDCLTDYYDPQEKSATWRPGDLPGFSFAEVDLRTGDLRALLDGATVVFHQAGQPGVRMSWGAGFSDYCEHNVKATQRLSRRRRRSPRRASSTPRARRCTATPPRTPPRRPISPIRTAPTA